MGNYVYEVLRCNEPPMSWQMEKPILSFIYYVHVTDGMSLAQMLLALIIVVIMAHGVIMEQCGCQLDHHTLACGLLFEFEFW